MSIPEQPRLGFVRTLQITLEGLRYRLFRSLLLVISITVAVGFVMNTLAEGLVHHDLARYRLRVLGEMDELARESSRWLSAPTEDELLAELAGADPGSRPWLEARHFGNLDQAELDFLQSGLSQAGDLAEFLEGLNATQRLVLVGTDRGVAALDRLHEKTARHQFLNHLARFRGVRLPWDERTFVELLDNWPRLRAGLGKIHAGRRGAVVAASRALRLPPADALAKNSSAASEAVRAAGFRLDADQLLRLTTTARRLMQTREIEDALSISAVRQVIAERAGIMAPAVKPADFWEVLATSNDLEWFRSVWLKHSEGAAGFGEEELRALAARRRLELLVGDSSLSARNETGALLETRTAWLIGLASLVCVVGIVNAMLMSVVERYREIATLKCLGALDRFILGTFFAEGCLLGLAGGLGGALLGAGLGFSRMWMKFPLLAPAAINTAVFLQAMLATACAGVILAALAALYPAWRAARLAPMEAMRVE